MAKKICVIGAGRWGTNHIKTLASLGVLAGVVETNQARSSDIKRSYPTVQIFKHLQDALKTEFDGFTIATPAVSHFAIAKCIIEHKKPVMVEKPLALTAKEANTLLQLAKKHDVNLMVGHLLLFHPAIRKIKELVTNNTIGKLQYLYSNRLNLGTVRTEENILWSFAPHDISIFQYFINERPLEVVSKGGAFIQPHLHDTTMTILKYPNNIVGHIFVSWLHPYKEHKLVLIGSKGMLSFEDSSEEKNILFYEKGIDWVQGEPIKRDGPTDVIHYEQAAALTEELRYFIDHIDNGNIEIADGQNGVEVLEILEQATSHLLKEESTTEQTREKHTDSYFVHPSSYVGDNVTIGEGTKVWHFSHIMSGSKIGQKCSLGQNVVVGNNVTVGNSVKIQNNVSIYEGVQLEDHVFCGPSMVFTNVLDPRSKYPQRGAEFYHKTLVKVGASLGANSTIVCGNTIGAHAFIGAGAVITKDVPDYALMVGVPARQVGWVCECGEKLPEFSTEISCPRCNLAYALRAKELSKNNFDI